MLKQISFTNVLDPAAAPVVPSMPDLLAVAFALGARSVAGWSPNEEDLAATLPAPDPASVAGAQHAIQHGADPLGDAYCRLLSAEQRRPMGATYTPRAIVAAMLQWAATQVCPARVVDAGTGSARFLVGAGRMFPQAALWGVESDPRAALLARGHLAAAGFAPRAYVAVGDYRAAALPAIAGPTLFVGNPPYVRHHLLEPRWKAWLVQTARKYGLAASQLAGLHVHFFLATAEYARPGDIGVLITAAEWLDVNYGRFVRELLLDVLGVKTIHIIEPAALPFPDAAATAVITGFAVGARPKAVGVRRVAHLDELGALSSVVQVPRERLEAAGRWTLLTHAVPEQRAGFVELGELCRVHRGQVTGANQVWIEGRHSADLPESVLFRTVTKARELFQVQDVLADASHLRRVIDLPVDLDIFAPEDRRRIERFLAAARAQGADSGFIARHRKAWWAVGLRDPAPILATYMARRPPAFVRNLAGARHINIAHGLYPRVPLAEPALRALALYLSNHTLLGQGRTYAGGLTKFEPREMERLLVPGPELLLTGHWAEVPA